jgi:serine/threonine protein kinase
VLYDCPTTVLPTLEAVNALRQGVDVGPCKLGQRIYPGALSAIFIGYDDSVDTDIVLKTARATTPAHLDAGVEQITREARILPLINHPLIPRLYRVSYYKGVPVLELERKNGVPLVGYVNQMGGQLPWQEVARIGLDLTDELEYIHLKGILHRDVKPGNIFYSNGRAVLLDFGIGRAPGESRHEKPERRTLSKPWAAPEQYDGITSEASDMFSYGATLYTLIEGRSPYVDLEDHTKLHPFTVGLPLKLKSLIERLLSIDPAQRPTATQAKQMLEEILAAA